MKNVWIFLLPLCLLACEGTDEPLPAFLHITGVDVETTPEQGSDNARVTNAFVDANFDELGIVNLPITVPVLERGQVNIRLDPVVRANGSSGSVDVYPFYERFETTLDLSEGQIDTIRPVVGYRDDAIFAFVEDFESGNLFTEDRDGDTETRLEVITNGAFEGASGRVRLTEEHPTVELATSVNLPFALPTDVRDVWLEVNFRTDVPLLFGLIGQNNVGDEAPAYEWVLNPRTTYSKIYLDMTEAVTITRFPTYRISFLASLAGSELNEGSVFLDNVKFIYR